MLTINKLRRFAKRRNKSGHQSNLQFQIDADASGFEVSELGDPIPFLIDGFKGYEWKPVINSISVRCNQKQEVVRLIEFGRSIYIVDDDDADTISMLELMKKAEYQKPAV